jgi:cell division septal protein FtsQ
MAVKKTSKESVPAKGAKKAVEKSDAGSNSSIRKFFITLLLVLLVVFCVLVIWIICIIPGKLMYENPRFKLKNIEVKSHGFWHGKGDILISRLGKEALPEMNIFRLNVGNIRKKLLEVPNVEDAEVQIVLPDMLVCNIRERIPRAEFGGGAVIDEHGVIFKRSESSAANRTLPRLIVKNPDKKLQKEAISLIMTATRECRNIIIQSIKIDSYYHFEVNLQTMHRGDQNWKVLFPIGSESYSILFNKLQNAILHSYLKRDNPIGFDLRFKTYATPIYK